MTRIKWWRAAAAGLAAKLASFVVGGGGYLLFGRMFRSPPLRQNQTTQLGVEADCVGLVSS